MVRDCGGVRTAPPRLAIVSFGAGITVIEGGATMPAPRDSTVTLVIVFEDSTATPVGMMYGVEPCDAEGVKITCGRIEYVPAAVIEIKPEGKPPGRMV